MTIKIATWNINSVRLRLGLVARLIAEHQPDIVCLQEIKCTADQFPREEVAALGFPHIELVGQKGYHGVATLSRMPIRRLCSENLDESGEARHLGVQVLNGTAGGLAPIIHNFYVPAGGDEPDPAINRKFKQKLAYLEAMAKWFGNGTSPDAHSPYMLLLGDLNVAPLETDVWSHKQLLKVVSHTPAEVERLDRALAAGGWVDIVRRFIPPEQKLFTWWSYRARDWRASDRGRRLDHIWTTPEISKRASKVTVLKEARDWDKPSDHVPVMVELDLNSS